MKRGRPKLPDGQAKESQLNLRLQDSEREKIQAAAAKDGVEVSEWVRGKLFPAPKPAGQTVLDWRCSGIYFVTPSDLSIEDWERLRKYIDVLKPAE